MPSTMPALRGYTADGPKKVGRRVCGPSRCCRHHYVGSYDPSRFDIEEDPTLGIWVKEDSSTWSWFLQLEELWQLLAKKLLEAGAHCGFNERYPNIAPPIVLAAVNQYAPVNVLDAVCDCLS